MHRASPRILRGPCGDLKNESPQVKYMTCSMLRRIAGTCGGFLRRAPHTCVRVMRDAQNSLCELSIRAGGKNSPRKSPQKGVTL
jgi:hypothetical protein